MRLRRVGAAAACLTVLGVAVALAVPAVSTGCETHQCDSAQINDDPDGGFGTITVLDSGFALWESTPLEPTGSGPPPAWLPYPGQMTYFFTFPTYFTPVQPPVPYVSTVEAPNPYGGPSYVVAAGQLAEINSLGAYGPFIYGFNVTNATCADYYLYVSVLGTYAPPAPPAPTPEDAGSDAPTDAPTDGLTDAATETSSGD